jgi:hypothetical protein
MMKRGSRGSSQLMRLILAGGHACVLRHYGDHGGLSQVFHHMIVVAASGHATLGA